MTEFNLTHSPWITARHASGRLSLCELPRLLGPADDPIVSLASPRADLDCALYELLIGLLQLVAPPADDDEWRHRYESPPSPAWLAERLKAVTPALDLLGEGRRYQQDSRVASFGGEVLPTEKLLIDLGLNPGSDLFGRNGSVGALCLPCAASALTALQSFAPTGGRGHMTSLRGGGPLSTFVEPVPEKGAPPPSLWRKLWLNVLPLDRSGAGRSPKFDLARVFPWFAEQGEGEPATAPTLSPEDAHGLQIYFGMPRRIWLEPPTEGRCGLCGTAEAPVISGYRTRPNGLRYEGAWEHSLSPYRRFKGETWISAKGSATGLGYRHWLGFAWLGQQDDGPRPARVVREALGDRQRRDAAGGGLRIRACGYAMDNMKALAWSEAHMPIFEVAVEGRPVVTSQARTMIEGAKLAESYLRKAIKQLIARRPKDVKGNLIQISTRFWARTESAFYRHLEASVEAPKDPDALMEIRATWHTTLIRACNDLFNLEMGESDFRAANPRQVATAWNDLQKKLFGKKLRTTTLQLPPQTRKPKGSVDEPTAEISQTLRPGVGSSSRMASRVARQAPPWPAG